VVESVGRIFAAAPLPPEIKLALSDRVSKLDIPGKLVPPENWHITLRFLGSVDQVVFERLLGRVAETTLPRPFSIRLRGISGFPTPRKATVVWVDLDEDSHSLVDLSEIIEDAAQSAGVAPEERPFRPHLTLARVRPQSDISHLLEQQIDLEWIVSEIVIFRSHLGKGGARYEVLETFAL
jgi:RNA 2',3'-cyclic 3'-phosphodiesterase